MGKSSLPARTRVLEADTWRARSNLSSANTVSSTGLREIQCANYSNEINERKKKHLFSYLHKAGQHGVKDVSSLFHDSHILGGGVSALAVLDGVDEAVSELAQ